MIIILETRMLYLILSGLRLHVTGLMKNANNLITISCFLPKKFPLWEFTDPAFIPSIIQSTISGQKVLFSFFHAKPQSSIQF